jgi:Domain of unknown function (DUF4388)/Carboxypeptidase regulatory-like domain
VPIQGNLDEAPVADILQLLSLGRKSGCLALTDGTLRGEIYLDGGRVCQATVFNRRDRLGDLLVRSGKLTRQQLDEAIAEHRASGARRVSQILVESGQVARRELEQFVRAGVEEAVYFMFSWQQGSFAFTSSVRPQFQDFLVSIDPEGLLLEGARRVDEWSLIKKKIPSFDLVFRIDRARLNGSAANLTEEQQRIVPLVDGSRDCAAIVEMTGFSDFEVGKALYGLITAGFASLVERRAAMRHLDYRELLAYVVKEAGFADPERRKAAARHIADCATCTARLKSIHVRRTGSAATLPGFASDAPREHTDAGATTVVTPVVAPPARPASPAPGSFATTERPRAPAAAPAPLPPAAELTPEAAPPPAEEPEALPERRVHPDRRALERRLGGDRRRAAAREWASGGRVERRSGGDRRDAARRGPERRAWTPSGGSAAVATASAFPATRRSQPDRRTTGPRRIPTADRRSALPVRPQPVTTRDWTSRPAAISDRKSGPAANDAAEPLEAAAPPPPPVEPEVSAPPELAQTTPVVPEESTAAHEANVDDEERHVDAPAAEDKREPRGRSAEFSWLVSPDEADKMIRTSWVELQSPRRRSSGRRVTEKPKPSAAAPVAPPRPTAAEHREAIAMDRTAGARGDAEASRPALRPARRDAPPRRIPWIVVAAVLIVLAGAGILVKPLIQRQPPQPSPVATTPPPAATTPQPAPASSVPEPGEKRPQPTTVPIEPVQRATPAVVKPAPATTRTPAPVRSAPPVQEPPPETPVTTTPPPAAVQESPPALVAPPAASPPPAAATTTIHGTVRAAGTGTPIAGVLLTVAGRGLSATTDPSGSYTIADVPAGTATIELAVSGRPSGRQDVVASAGVAATADFTVSAPLTAAQPDDDLTTGEWVTADARQIAEQLGGFIAVVPGLWVESITAPAAGSRRRARVAQLTATGERIVLTETRSGAPGLGGGTPRVTALRVIGPTEAYPLSTGTASFGSLLVTAKTTLPVDSLRAMLGKLATIVPSP